MIAFVGDKDQAATITINPGWLAQHPNDIDLVTHEAMHIVQGYPGHGDPSRLYFGTDTHGFPLLLGAALGLAWQPGRANRTIQPFPRALGVLSGLLALALLRSSWPT